MGLSCNAFADDLVPVLLAHDKQEQIDQHDAR